MNKILAVLLIVCLFGSIGIATAAKPPQVPPETPSLIELVYDLKATVAGLQTSVSDLWGNATEQQSAIEAEVGARTGDVQALWANASEQQSAIVTLPKPVVIVKGETHDGDIIYPPMGFTISDCDIIIRPARSVTLEYYGIGGLYVASGLIFYAEESYDSWSIRARINYHVEDSPTQTQESYPEMKYTVICPCTTVDV